LIRYFFAILLLSMVPQAVPGGDKRSSYADASPLYRTIERDGTWWLTGPDRARFLITGCELVIPGACVSRSLGFSQYQRTAVSRYGSLDRWGDTTAARLRSWGFNTISQTERSDANRIPGLRYIRILRLGQDFAQRRSIIKPLRWTGFPDVFDPEFARFCDERARAACSPTMKDSILIGYYLDNELEWMGATGRASALFDAALGLDSVSCAKKAAVAMLRGRYGSIGRLNRQWGTHFAGFNRLLPDPIAVPSALTQADAAAYAGLCAREYFETACTAVRKYDPDHLILGCRFAGTAPREAWRECAKQCDVVSVNLYPRIDLFTGAVIGVEDSLRRWHALTGRPLLVTEWSFPALDAGLPCRTGAGMRVDDQDMRAYCVRRMQSLLARLPYVVGSSIFMWQDDPAGGAVGPYPEDCNYGLVDVDDHPYEQVTQAFREINGRYGDLHRTGRAFALKTPELAMHGEGARATSTMPVFVDTTARSYTIRNGALRLVKVQGSGDCFDTIEYAGRALGHYSVMVWQDNDGWLLPDKATLNSIQRLPAGGLHLSFLLDRADNAARPGFAMAVRITMDGQAPCFTAEVTQITNTGSRPWNLNGYLHYPMFFETDSSRITVVGIPQYWLPSGAWVVEGKGVLAAGARPDGPFQFNFYIDQYRRGHPDALHPMSRILSKGESVSINNAVVLIAVDSSIARKPAELFRSLFGNMSVRR
jgi:hypothetical protein